MNKFLLLLTLSFLTLPLSSFTQDAAEDAVEPAPATEEPAAPAETVPAKEAAESAPAPEPAAPVETDTPAVPEPEPVAPAEPETAPAPVMPVADSEPPATTPAPVTEPAPEPVMPVAESDPAATTPAPMTEPETAPAPEVPVVETEPTVTDAPPVMASPSENAAAPTSPEEPAAAPVVPATSPESMPAETLAAPATPEPAATAEELAALPPVPAAPPRPVAEVPVSAETTQVLADTGRRDRASDAAAAEKIEDKDDAKKLILTILGGAAAGAVAGKIVSNNEIRKAEARRGYRPPVEEVGRTQQSRDRNVDYMVRRFEGGAPAPSAYPDPRFGDNQGGAHGSRHPQYYDGNRRVVRYSSAREIPPVLIASQELNRVEVQPVGRSDYGYPAPAQSGQSASSEIPRNYVGSTAQALSYRVDPNSAVSQSEILFRQGSTDFADAYSYDLVIDMAEAMNHPSLLRENFVIEGHASAEGEYGKNLALSQERAERISRDLVYYGVSPERLLPVGYGEAEAAYAANTPEQYRRLDRRVMVFRLIE